jgi:allophanate hydrolase
MMTIQSNLDCLRLAVVGAHLTGMPLNHELAAQSAIFVEKTTTAKKYRLFKLTDTLPPKPGLSRCDNEAGAAIEVELWDLPLCTVGSFLAGIPAPLGLGTLELIDGRAVHGFICEAYAIRSGIDITSFGGWRNYCNSIRHLASPQEAIAKPI